MEIIALKGKALLAFNKSAMRFEIQVAGQTVDHAESYPLALAKLELNK